MHQGQAKRNEEMPDIFDSVSFTVVINGLICQNIIAPTTFLKSENNI